MHDQWAMVSKCEIRGEMEQAAGTRAFLVPWSHKKAQENSLKLSWQMTSQCHRTYTIIFITYTIKLHSQRTNLIGGNDKWYSLHGSKKQYTHTHTHTVPMCTGVLVSCHGENACMYTQHLHNCCIYAKLGSYLETICYGQTHIIKKVQHILQRNRERERERENDLVEASGARSIMPWSCRSCKMTHVNGNKTPCHTSHIRTYADLYTWLCVITYKWCREA